MTFCEAMDQVMRECGLSEEDIQASTRFADANFSYQSKVMREEIPAGMERALMAEMKKRFLEIQSMSKDQQIDGMNQLLEKASQVSNSN